MTVYNINLGIGWASSGVEYAQKYRAENLRSIGVDSKFVFTDLILDENIIHFTRNLDYKDSEIIWLYNYFTDMDLKPTTFTLADLEDTFELKPIKVERNLDVVRYIYEDDYMITAYLARGEGDLVNRAEYVSRNCLIRKDFYMDKKFMSEYYIPKDNRAHLYQRRYFNSDGSTAYEERVDGNNSIFVFKDAIIYSKEELVEYFIKKLNLNSKDIVILDRTTQIGQPILKNVKPAKVGVVVHAEHFSENATDEKNILWNNFYEYTFSNTNKIDFYITSTQLQSDILKSQFEKYYGVSPKIYTIPVGSVDQLTYPISDRKKYSLITASRLAGEKNITWLVEAVSKLKKEIPNITFDIYGSGPEENKISALIKKLGATDYIHLKGHQNLKDVYKNYELYVSASGSEGFGLTLLEAISSGLPIVGFDVNYGNPTFINNNKNGYLVPKKYDDSTILIEEFTKYLRKVYFENNIDKMIEESYKVAENFLTKKVNLLWDNLIKEVLNND
ncbi:accessory Sec system glycosyltransferase GtfA [Gemelliphila palaticanis]|uniref:UDP-N-acetylglucosamine--peptide N-acetylglucosaminyltransferase GtfA subunit n=1 Tax=Gemelliphila palaticanis TaxID=81950 RepID=A0ABX2T3J9_9BACL|nr:accessory Sec system glycosyltransferase GtfA [Gemella palaticanis]MBF0716094.1 accessory Sec system glycosyltransferase GtfA [Gemella palaticanis]NYS48024.1 accessory Sec system glycosyltransferase GtfA [Gemella palaticanis]